MRTRYRSPSTRRWSAARIPALVAVTLLGFAEPAVAQLRLPSIGLPSLSRLPSPSVQGTLDQAVSLKDLRASTVRDLLRRYPDRIEPDPSGHPVRRGELIWLAPSPQARQAALAQGFTVLREQDLPELGLRQLVMRAPEGEPIAAAAQRLRALEPDADVDFNHIYLRSGDTGGSAAPASAPVRGLPRRVGLIDGGVDRRHAAFAQAHIQSFGCSGRELPSAHGTAVASLLVGRDGVFAGVQPSAELFAADVYCDQPDGGAAEDMARALAWMVRERAPVINISLVGPPNMLMDKAIQAVIRQGHLVVAAVGNDGPAAAALYPASYPGVVGVSGVAPSRRALPEAAQGPQVILSAPGSELVAARSGGGYVAVRGTSFAAPIVAGLLCEALSQPDTQAAAVALAQLERAATDLGEPGRDNVFGYGLVGESARTPPDRVAARRP
ncbi:MAG TPA: S8 family serine peptidase [Burkholderiaceae bacterium]|nr:S8 family serine peptidase [Burkholderiaceae bacterium]